MNVLHHALKTLAFILALHVSAVNADQDVIAIVNGVEISKSKYEMLINSQINQGQKDTPEFRQSVLDVMITREIVAQEALNRKINEDPLFMEQLEATKEQLLLNLLFEQITKASEPDEAVKFAEYVKIKKARRESKEYLVRHILVEDKDSADSIIARITAGEDFSTLAKELSIDSSTKDIGGKLDWATPERFVKAFSEAMVRLTKEEVTSEPIRSNVGYHVIEVLDIRDSSFPEYIELADQIRKDLITQKRDTLISDLRDAATIQTFDQ